MDKNILMHGDNLNGLRTIKENYESKIKCIYIDPPYNTKQNFSHYADNMSRLSWMKMMKERLVIMRDLLRDDGSIWISIDDRECHYLKVVCDEIFGRKNFVSNVVWQKRTSPNNQVKFMSVDHEHLLVFLKNKKKGSSFNLFPRTAKMNASFSNPDNDPRGAWVKRGLLNNRLDDFIKGTTRHIYPVINKIGDEIYPPEGRSWLLSQESYEKLRRDGRIVFTSDESVPCKKAYLSEVLQGKVCSSLWFSESSGTSSKGTSHSSEIFGRENGFVTQKPERLLQRIIHLATNPGDIVLDSFAGSGTTGAVAQKMGRKWIMMEQGNHCLSHIIPRMDKVCSGEDQGGISKDVDWKGGGQFYLVDI